MLKLCLIAASAVLNVYALERIGTHPNEEKTDIKPLSHQVSSLRTSVSAPCAILRWAICQALGATLLKRHLPITHLRMLAPAIWQILYEPLHIPRPFSNLESYHCVHFLGYMAEQSICPQTYRQRRQDQRTKLSHRHLRMVQRLPT